MIRQENIQLSSDTQEFRKLYHPTGNRYLRGLDSYLYHKDLAPISEAERLIAKGINPMGVRPVNVSMPLPANATRAQTTEWILRTQAYKNPRVGVAGQAPSFQAGWATNGVNRERIERNSVGMIYSEAKIASSRTAKVLPIY